MIGSPAISTPRSHSSPDFVAEVRGCAQAIAAAASEVSNSAGNLSERTSRQAATLEESSTSVQSLIEVITEAANASSLTKDNIQDADREAERSRAVVSGTIASMKEIEESSRRIGMVVEVIDDIAFQTNLLALNAGVEAARAGEAGGLRRRGVRSSRARATFGVGGQRGEKALMVETDEAVEEGARQMSQTAGAFEAIKAHIPGIDHAIFDVERVRSRRSRRSRNLNLAILQVDQETQQNSRWPSAQDGLRLMWRSMRGARAQVGAFRLTTDENQASQAAA